MQSVEILVLKWRDCSTLVFVLNNDHHPVRPLKWSQGTNNMHNCPNSDALQVFFIQNGGPPDTNYVEVFQITSQSDFQSVTATSCGYTKCSKYPRLLIDERFLSFSWP